MYILHHQKNKFYTQINLGVMHNKSFVKHKPMGKQLKTISLKQDRNFFLMIIILGIIVNYIAFSSNGFQMPVRTEYQFDDGFHFSYQESSEVKVWLLTDIFNIKDRFVFSLGDVIIIIGLLGLIIKNLMIIKNEKQ